MKRLREEAARRDTTMSALVEAGLRRILDEAASRTTCLHYRERGRGRVDVADREALEAVLGSDGPYPTAGA